MAECERAWFAIAPEGVNKLARGPLLDCVHFLGLNPTKRVMRDFCQGRGTEAVFTVDDLSDLAGRVPVTTQAGLTDAFRLVRRWRAARWPICDLGCAPLAGLQLRCLFGPP